MEARASVSVAEVDALVDPRSVPSNRRQIDQPAHLDPEAIPTPIGGAPSADQSQLFDIN